MNVILYTTARVVEVFSVNSDGEPLRGLLAVAKHGFGVLPVRENTLGVEVRQSIFQNIDRPVFGAMLRTHTHTHTENSMITKDQ